MKRFFLIGILCSVLVFATSYRTGETWESPSTGIVDASASAYLYWSRRSGNSIRRVWHGSASISVYATQMGGDTPNRGGFTYEYTLGYSSPFRSSYYSFSDGVSYSDYESRESDRMFHCSARATISATYGGYDHDRDVDGECFECN